MLPHAVGREGELRLAFTRQGERTILTENYSRPPLQVMRAIEDAANCLCVYLLSPTGGIVQGDRYTIHIEVGEGAHALCTTQSATKIYKMPAGCAEQQIRIEVGRGAVFEFVPDAAILFADTDLTQNIEIMLHPGALLFLHEIVMPGRLARGECLQFRRYANRLIVRDSAGLLLHDAANVQPVLANYAETGILEGYACWGSAYLLGDLAAWGIDAEAFCQTHQPALEQRDFVAHDAIGALTPLYRNGVTMRMVSQRLETIYAAFHHLRETVRTKHLNLPEASLRK